MTLLEIVLVCGSVSVILYLFYGLYLSIKGHRELVELGKCVGKALETYKIQMTQAKQGERERTKFFFFTAGEDIEVGQVVYLDRLSGKLYLATGVQSIATARQDYKKGDIITVPSEMPPIP